MAYFNIRVYGILLDENHRLLVSDEFIRGNYYTKLPGGGMEIGEGTRDCLKREFKEETGLEIEVGEHFYTTDFYQISAFNNKDQIVSIYYKVYTNDIGGLISSDIPFNFTASQIVDLTKEAEVFRWVTWQELSKESVSLPIDKVVIELLKPNT